MLIKVNNEYLDFNELVDMEKQIKLFEDISTTDGDFSYAFDIPKTINNTRILESPFPDNVSKLVYQKIPASLLSDNGEETFQGYLRIERITEVYQCSFFAGNNNWFGMLTGALRSMDWSQYDLVQDQSAVQDSTLNSSGVVFPLVDNGLLFQRGAGTVKVQDFVPAIYVKDVFNKIFSSHGIKIQGDLLNDVNYQSAITLNSTKNQAEIDARSSLVRTTNAPTNHGSDAFVKIVWTDDSTYPYHDGGNFDLPNSRYVADVPMTIKVTWIINDLIVPGIAAGFTMAFYINGVNEYEVLFTQASPYRITKIFKLEIGDVVEMYARDVNVSIFADPITDSTVEFSPVYIYKAFGNSIVPPWTQQEYVSAVLRVFNVLTWFDSKNKTLTFDLFDKIKSKPAIDLSEFVSEVDVDYIDFISDYYKKSYLSFKELEPDEDFLKKNFQFRPYSKGVINIDNDFLEDDGDILESEFTNPITYVNPALDMSIEKTDLLSVEGQETTNATGVTNSSGRARFAVDDDIFLLGDLVRISEAQNIGYNGDFVVYTMGAGYVEFSKLLYLSNSTAKLERLSYTYSDSSDVFLLRNVPTYNISKFSTLENIMIENTDIETWSPAYFSLIDKGLQISRDFRYSFSFSDDYQISLIEQYFGLTGRVLNDPVKLFVEAHLSHALFNQIDFLSPILIKTLETTNLYYLNRISGYKESFLPCEIHLIKLP